MNVKGKEDFANTGSDTKACVYCVSGAGGRNVIACRPRQKTTTRSATAGDRVNTKIATMISTEL